jgi:hypothetical protein
VSRLPPIVCRPSSRALRAGRWLAAATALAIAVAGVACDAPTAEESVAGLVFASAGVIGVTNAEGQVEPIEGPAERVRLVTASNGRIVAATTDREFFVSDPPEANQVRTWRPLPLDTSSGRTLAGMDLSLDGRKLAIVLGDPEAPDLELVTINVVGGEASTRSIDLMANGPPSWLDSERLLLEVIRPDQHSGIATVDLGTGEVAVGDAQGFTPSATRDGSRIAVADAASGVVTIVDPTDWLAGVPGNSPGITSPAESSVQDVAIDANGSRLAVAYAADSGTSFSVTMFRLDGTAWRSVASIPIPGDAAVSVDWLD